MARLGEATARIPQITKLDKRSAHFLAVTRRSIARRGRFRHRPLASSWLNGFCDSSVSGSPDGCSGFIRRRGNNVGNWHLSAAPISAAVFAVPGKFFRRCRRWGRAYNLDRCRGSLCHWPRQAPRSMSTTPRHDISIKWLQTGKSQREMRVKEKNIDSKEAKGGMPVVDSSASLSCPFALDPHCSSRILLVQQCSPFRYRP